jgi:hypothetical protein
MRRSAILLLALAPSLGVSGRSALAAPGGAKDPETVFVTYHVRAGKEAEMERLMREDHWPLLRRLGLVHETPHVLVRGTEADGKPFLREVLTWRDHDTPDNAPPEVEAVWKHMYDFVEKRGGAPAIEIQEVDLLVPAP